MFKFKIKEERGIYFDSINQSLQSIYTKVSKSESSKECIVALNDKWAEFVDFEYNKCNINEKVLELYKVINFELDRLNNCIEKDSDFTYLHLQISMISYVFEHFIEDPDEFFKNNFLENIKKSFNYVFDLTSKIFAVKNEIDRNIKIATAAKSKKQNISEVDKKYVDAGALGCELIVSEKNDLLNTLQNVYLLKCKECSVDATKYEHLVDIAVDSKNNIEELMTIKNDSTEKIDEICASALCEKNKSAKITFVSSDLVVISHDGAKEIMDKLESMDTKLDSSNNKLDSLDLKIDNELNEVKELIKSCSESSVSSIVEEFKKLDTKTISEQISKLYLLLENKSKAENEFDTEKTILATEIAASYSDVSLKEYVKSLYKDGITVNKITSAYANIRALIDAYCRYNCGIQLNANQRPFGYLIGTKSQNGIEKPIYSSKKTDLYKICFKDDVIVSRVFEIDRASNQYIHRSVENMIDIENDAKLTIKAAEYLNDELGIDFGKIDYKAGVKKLIKQELAWEKILNSQINSKKKSLADLKEKASGILLPEDEEKIKNAVKSKEKDIKDLEQELDFLKKRLSQFQSYLTLGDNEDA